MQKVEMSYQFNVLFIIQMKTYKFFGVAETGLDIKWQSQGAPLAQQESSFKWHLQLASAHNIPIVFHCRDMHDQMFAIA